MKKLYLYLANRSKRGIKLIAVLYNESTVNLTKITNIDELNVPLIWKKEIHKAITDNYMLYQALMETAASFTELKSRLKHRGYTNLPMGDPQILNLSNDNIPITNIKKRDGRRTMIQKGKK